MIIQKTGQSFIKGTIYSFIFTNNMPKSLRTGAQNAQTTLITLLTQFILDKISNSSFNIFISLLIGNIYTNVLFKKNLLSPLVVTIFNYLMI